MQSWSEISLIVRAGSKALLIPFTILYFVPIPFGPSIAVIYLASWTYENVQTFNAINAGNNNAGVPGGDAAVLRRREKANRAQMEALAVQANDVVYMSEESTCPICLEEFPKDCFNKDGTLKSSQALLESEVLVLRCGHPLHFKCAKLVTDVENVRARRCPMCREPLNLEGSISARVFN